MEMYDTIKLSELSKQEKQLKHKVSIGKAVYYAVFAGCNKTTPVVLAVGSRLSAIEKTVCALVDVRDVDSLNVYEFDLGKNDEAISNDDEYSEDITHVPFTMDDIDQGTHLISFELTSAHTNALLKKLKRSHANLGGCCVGNTISIFVTSDESVDLVDLISRVNII